MYVCGPTPYDHTHVGHARAYISYDIMRRFFEYLGYKVKLVINITDIDDKIINRAREEGVSWRDISERYTRDFFETLEKLHVKHADAYPKVTDHVKEIVEMVSKLIEKGHAYVTPDGSVYFSIESVPRYGEFSGQDIKSLIAGARVKPEPYKRNPLDFALWKAWKPGEPWWGSPWSPGRPGWHIECVVMSSKYLGEVFDIHGGGQDLVFPHHENEVAIARAYFGEGKFARYWLHVGLLTVRGEKMSKSLKNIVPVKDLLAKYDSEVYRLFVASTHYRKPLDFSFEKLDQYVEVLDTLYTAHDYLASELASREVTLEQALKAPEELSEEEKRHIAEVEKLRREFEEAMANDFHFGEALAAYIKMARHIMVKVTREKIPTAALTHIYKVYVGIGEVFGVLNNRAPPKNLQDLATQLIKLVTSVRQELRKRKMWELADKIREEARKLGIEFHDTRDRTLWKIVREFRKS